MSAETHDKNRLVREVADRQYAYGFTTDVPTEIIPNGLNEDVVRLISSKKGEPEWLLEFRLKAYRHWLTLETPTWGHVNLPPIEISPAMETPTMYFPNAFFRDLKCRKIEFG